MSESFHIKYHSSSNKLTEKYTSNADSFLNHSTFQGKITETEKYVIKQHEYDKKRQCVNLETFKI